MADSPATDKSTAAGSTESVLRWDDSTAINTYANVSNVSFTREEMSLNFGLDQAGERREKRLPVRLTNRIILNSSNAKRLALVLNAAVQQHEARFGPVNIGGKQPATTGQNDRPSTAAVKEIKPHAVK